MLGQFLGRFKRLNSVTGLLSGAFCAAMLFSGTNASANVYYGNGNGGFGGALGGGSLTVTDDGSGNVTFSLSPNASNFGGNAVALYIDNGNSSGLSDTSTLMDNADNGRSVVSGYASATADPIVYFPTGFKAAFGISFEDGGTSGKFDGVFGLPGADPAATVTNLHYIIGQSANGDPATVTVSVAQLGLTEGQSFNFLASLISNTDYRSDEAIGSALPSGNPGFTGTETFTSFDTFTTPEPASLGAIALLGVMGLRRRTRATSAS